MSAVAEPEEKDEDASKEDEGEADSSEGRQPVDTEGLQLIEAVVRNDSMMNNRSVRQLRLNQQFGLHLVAVARDGSRLSSACGIFVFKPAMYYCFRAARTKLVIAFLPLGCLPLANRELQLGQPR